MSKTIPKLRFREFEGKWVNKKLETIVEKVNSGKTPLGGESVYVPNGVLFIRSQNVLDSKLSLANSTYITEEVNSTMKNSIVKAKDILLNITGASLGRSCVVPDDFTIGNVNQHVCIIRLSKENDPYFLQPIFASEKGQNLFTSLQTGSGREGLNFQSIKNASLSFPTLPEQQKIASFLSAVDEKIKQLAGKKELLEQYKKGVMQQLFCLHYDSSDSGDGHDDLPNHGNQKNHSKSQFRQLRFKDENGKMYPKWEEKRLGEIGDIISGLTYSPEDIHEDGVLVLRSSNVQNRKLTFDDNVYVKVEKEDFNPVKENDILICVRNGSKDLIGKNAIIDKNNIGVAFGAFMTVYRSKYNKFLFHFFDTDIYNKEVHKNLGATINSINGSDLKKFKFPFPSEPEQQKIASFLSAIDTKIESVASQIEKTQTFKKGLLQQMFV